jgi:hypothetical protein
MSGKRHSKEDHGRIRQARGKAREIDAIMAELGDDEWDGEGDGAAKSLSLEEHCNQVRSALLQAMELARIYGWVEYTYPDYAIVNIDGAYYRANYTMADGMVTADPVGSWPRVEREWMAPGTKAAPARPARPAVKVAGEYTLRGYGVVFGGKDLMGDTFTRETDYGEARSFVGMPVYYDHALGGLKSQIGEVKAFEFADDGIIFEIEIDRRKQYADTVMRLANERALGQSSGAVAHLVHAEQGEIKRWVIGEISVTPIPAEPRTSADPLKTLLAQAGSEAPGEGAGSAATPDLILILD